MIDLAMEFEFNNIKIKLIEYENTVYITLKQFAAALGIKAYNLKRTINNHIEKLADKLIIQSYAETGVYRSFLAGTDKQPNLLIKTPPANILISEQGFQDYTYLSRVKLSDKFRKKYWEFIDGYKKKETQLTPQPTYLDTVASMLSKMEAKLDSALATLDRQPINEHDKSVIQKKVKTIALLLATKHGQEKPHSFYHGAWKRFNEAHNTNSYHNLQKSQFLAATKWLDDRAEMLRETMNNQLLLMDGNANTYKHCGLNMKDNYVYLSDKLLQIGWICIKCNWLRPINHIRSKY